METENSTQAMNLFFENRRERLEFLSSILPELHHMVLDMELENLEFRLEMAAMEVKLQRSIHQPREDMPI